MTLEELVFLLSLAPLQGMFSLFCEAGLEKQSSGGASGGRNEVWEELGSRARACCPREKPGKRARPQPLLSGSPLRRTSAHPRIHSTETSLVNKSRVLTLGTAQVAMPLEGKRRPVVGVELGSYQGLT